jgi:hypothetical protein
LLNSETINKILALLEKGFSQRKTAQLADVSVSTIQRIAHGKHSFIKNFEPDVTDSNTRNSYTPLNLHGETFRRYLDVRHKVESEIKTGKRTELSAIGATY